MAWVSLGRKAGQVYSIWVLCFLLIACPFLSTCYNSLNYSVSGPSHIQVSLPEIFFNSIITYLIPVTPGLTFSVTEDFLSHKQESVSLLYAPLTPILLIVILHTYFPFPTALFFQDRKFKHPRIMFLMHHWISENWLWFLQYGNFKTIICWMNQRLDEKKMYDKVGSKQNLTYLNVLTCIKALICNFSQD